MSDDTKRERDSDCRCGRPSSPPPEEWAEQHGDSGEMDFSTFVMSLATSAYVHMGLTPHPEGGDVIVELPVAKQTIDILGMLEEKTRCNLTEKEEGLLQQLLFDLRVRFIEVSQARS